MNLYAPPAETDDAGLNDRLAEGLGDRCPVAEVADVALARRESEPRFMVRRDASNAVPARVLTEGACHLVRFGSPAQLRDLLVLEHGRAIDGILQPFQRGLQMLHASLKGRDPGVRADVGRHRWGGWRFLACGLLRSHS